MFVAFLSSLLAIGCKASKIMNFSEEWKSLWPISASYAPPFLFPAAADDDDFSSPSPVGPLLFNPKPETHTLLFSSLCPPSSVYLNPPPSLSLPRFLQTVSSVLPTTSTAISAAFDEPLRQSDPSLSRNRLEPLSCFGGRTVLFFPTGDNLDRIGFLLLKVRDYELSVDQDNVFTSMVKFNQRIVQLSASAVSDWDDHERFTSLRPKGGVSVDVGFLMARTMFSIHWFRVSINGFGNQQTEKPGLVLLGSKLFKSSAIVDACWNPHLPEETLVLLESGDLFLFDVSTAHCPSSSTATPGVSRGGYNVRYRGQKLQFHFSSDDLKEELSPCWFSCAFSWHPRIVLLANSTSVFLADFRSEECVLTCLVTTDLLGNDDGLLVETADQFVQLCRAGSDGFYFAVASRRWLLLLDIRKPLMPLLRWMHSHPEPNHMSVFQLSTLRSALGGDGRYDQASEAGFAVLLGSVLSGDFSLFCYGPTPVYATKSISSTDFKLTGSFYAWALPSKVSLSGQDCPCGSCLLRKEFAKDDLPGWIEWQYRDDMVVGFFILNAEISSLMSKPDDSNDSGFLLVRLMSSGKLESQRYCACWTISTMVEPLHKEIPLDAKRSLFRAEADEEYRFVRRYQYIKLDYFYAFLNGTLAKVLSSKLQKNSRVSQKYNGPSHDFPREKLDQYGLDGSKASISVLDAVKETSMPLSIYDVASRKLWTELPMDILAMAFSRYEELLADGEKVSLDFLPIQDRKQLPPFILRNAWNRSNKWSSKVQPGNDIVGPVIPLPASLALNEIRENGRASIRDFSPEIVLAAECQELMHAAKEIAILHSGIDGSDNYAVSLADDKEDAWDSSQDTSPFFLYKPTAVSGDLPVLQKDSLLEDPTRFTTMITKVSKLTGIGSDQRETVGMEFFDDICPIELNYDDSAKLEIVPRELNSLKLLKGQFMKWQCSFRPYTEFCKQLKHK